MSSFSINRKWPLILVWSNRGAEDHPLCRVGVGFSYAEYGETVENTEEAAKNVQAFITIFFETFTQFAGRPLHLAGESYGVRTFA